LEYISLLSKGRPSAPDNIKLNRLGYNVSVGEECCFSLAQQNFTQYDNAKQKLVAKKAVKKELLQAREFVIQRYQQTINNLPSVPHEQYLDLIRVFTGCGNEVYQGVLDMILTAEITRDTQDVEWLVKLANHIELQNRSLALTLWKRAATLRPKGPQIIRKLAEYKEMGIV
jgi:hypothetical protein